MRGRSGSIRREALTTADFNKAEQHGKRQDRTSVERVVRDVPPLVYGSLDLAEARAQHMADVEQQQGKTAALHLMVQFPTALPGAENEKTQRAMLNHAVRFVNEYHGGDAVFAARLDRDEEGRHTVDVFAMPKSDFKYKDGRTVKRAVVSKHSKQHARARASSLIDPDDPKETKLDPEGSIMQGRALQAAWFEYLRDECGLHWVQEPERKKVRSKDRLEPEEYKMERDKERAAAEGVMIVAGAKQTAKTITQEAQINACDTVVAARVEARKIVQGATGQVAEALRDMNAKKAALEAWERDLKAQQEQVLRDAQTISAARRMMGERPVEEIEEIRTRTRTRSRGQDQR